MKAFICIVIALLLIQQNDCQSGGFVCKCQNGGVCINTYAGIKCSCENTGFFGENCTIPDLCASNPCQYGRCRPNNTDYSCLCIPGYSGVNCDTLIDFCNPNPCQNGGQCTKIGKFNYVCNCGDCNADYTGRNCEIRNYCSTKPCLNGGKCKNTNSTYQCICPFGYNGTNCENQIDFCSSNPCQSGGQCQNNLFGYRCKCSSNYTGDNCQYHNYCASKPCKNSASCENNRNNNGYNCECSYYYKGTKNCDTLYDPCNKNRCKPGKKCQSCYANPNSKCNIEMHWLNDKNDHICV